jgi:putative acetyltransferase
VNNGAIIRPEREADFAAVTRVHRDAFAQDDVPRIVELLRPSDAYVPELSLVAELDGEVVGHVILSRGHLDDRRVLALGPIGVLPAHQRSGIGSELMRVSLDRARALGHELVVLLGHPWYYPRFGFVPAATLGITGEWKTDAFMALELVPAGARGGGTFTFPRAFDAAVD